jgi:hypothetical protein
MFFAFLILFLIIWIGAYKGKHFFKSLIWVFLIYGFTMILSAMGCVPIF